MDIFEKSENFICLDPCILNRFSYLDSIRIDISLFIGSKPQNPFSGFHCADQRLCFHSIDSAIPLLSKSEIASLQPSSVVVQPGLCQTWSETQKTVFL